MPSDCGYNDLCVIVTNGASLKSVPVLRALKALGAKIAVGECFAHCPASHSRSCDASFVYPSPRQSPEEFVACLGGQARAMRARVIFPLNSPETLALALHRDLLPGGVSLPFGDYETMLRLHAKDKIVELAKTVGICVPRTAVCYDPETFAEATAAVGFPAVVKPAVASSSVGVTYHDGIESLGRALLALREKGLVSPTSPAIVQQRIFGNGGGTSVLMDHGRPAALVSHLRLREYPISGGSSTYRISVASPQMEDAAVRLLEAAGWHGLAMVEFKIEAASGTPVLMEVNPRVWGSIYQSIAAGVNFPALAVRLALGEPLHGIQRGTPGIRTMCDLGEVLALGSSLCHLRFDVLKDLLDVAMFRVRFDVFSLADPLPFLAFAACGARLVKRAKAA